MVASNKGDPIEHIILICIGVVFSRANSVHYLSVTGPPHWLLFQCYTSGTANSTICNMQIVDTKDHLQLLLNTLALYDTSNKLVINVKKSQAMTFTSYQRRLYAPKLLNELALERTLYKYLDTSALLTGAGHCTMLLL